MKYIVLPVLCITLAACGLVKPTPLTSDSPPVSSQADLLPVSTTQSFPEVGVCQSVKLFKKVSVQKPGSNISTERKKFSGRWGNGRWNGVLCQDIHVLRIHADNTAEIFDGQGPHQPWGVWAAGHMRKAQFIPAVDDRGDIMRVEHSGAVIDYWVKGDTMYGLRREKNGDQLAIKMARKPN